MSITFTHFKNVISYEVSWTWHLYLFGSNLFVAQYLSVNLNELNRHSAWRTAYSHKHWQICECRSSSLSSPVLALHGWQRNGKGRWGLFNLWLVVWSVAFILIQEGGVISLSPSLCFSPGCCGDACRSALPLQTPAAAAAASGQSCVCTNKKANPSSRVM